MDINQRINVGLARRGLLPMDGHCACAACRSSTLYREEIATKENYRTEFLEAVEATHGGRVCTFCADGAPCCVNCEMPAQDDERCTDCLENEQYYSLNRDIQ